MARLKEGKPSAIWYCVTSASTLGSRVIALVTRLSLPIRGAPDPSLAPPLAIANHEYYDTS